MKEITIKEIESVLENRPAGIVGPYQFFSVLAPLVEKEGRLHLLYELRGKNLGQHSGEICFPGGQMEAGETPEECAVRETCEELGLEPEDIRIIAQTDAIHAYGNFVMYSFLGEIPYSRIDSSKFNSLEVEDILLVPLRELLAAKEHVPTVTLEPRLPEDFPFDDIQFPPGYKWKKAEIEIPIYPRGDYTIWGLTGRLTKNLMKILREGGIRKMGEGSLK